MEYINIICPRCKHLNGNTNKCESCKYGIGEDNILLDIVLADYNQALRLISNRNIVRAKDCIKRNITAYPFSFEALNLAFLLGVETGEYEFAQEMLLQLKPRIAAEEYSALNSYLKSDVEMYNALVTHKRTTEPISYNNLSLFHLYLIFLKSEDVNSSVILKRLKEKDPHFTAALVAGPKTSTKFYWIGISLITMLALMAIVFSIKQTNRLKNTVSTAKEEKKMLMVELTGTKKSLEEASGLKTKLSEKKEKLALEIKDMSRRIGILIEEKEDLHKSIIGKDKDIKILEDELKELRHSLLAKEREAQAKIEKINQFIHVYNESRIKGAEFLAEHPEIVRNLLISEEVLQELSKYLYDNQKYELLLQIGYNSNFVSAAQGKLILRKYTAAKREKLMTRDIINELRIWESKNSPFKGIEYGDICKALIEYYEKSDFPIAIEYAQKLKKWVETMPRNRKYRHYREVIKKVVKDEI